MKMQLEICQEDDPGITRTIHGCVKDEEVIFYGPGCSNIHGICERYKKTQEKEKKEASCK